MLHKTAEKSMAQHQHTYLRCAEDDLEEINQH